MNALTEPPPKHGVHIDNLSVDFVTGSGLVSALRNVSIAAAPARIVGIVGESGGGKSTVGLALLGLLASNARIASGTLRLGGDRFDLTKAGATAALRGRRVAMIFQDPLASLNPVFTIRSHLHEALRRNASGYVGVQWDGVAEAALASVGIDRPRMRLDQYAHELSGGMRQRVAIAMAVLVRPELLIADEPTTALDVTVEAQVMAVIRQLRDSIGCSVLFVTHSLGLVAQHCDDVCVLYAGEVVEQGPVAAVMQQPGHPYTAALLSCEVAIDRPLQAQAADNVFRVVPSEFPDPGARAQGCIFRSRCEFAFEPCAVEMPAAWIVGGDATHTARCHLRKPRP